MKLSANNGQSGSTPTGPNRWKLFLSRIPRLSPSARRSSPPWAAFYRWRDNNVTLHRHDRRRRSRRRVLVAALVMVVAAAFEFAMVSVGMFVSSAGVAIAVVAVIAFSVYGKLNRWVPGVTVTSFCFLSAQYHPFNGPAVGSTCDCDMSISNTDKTAETPIQARVVHAVYTRAVVAKRLPYV